MRLLIFQPANHLEQYIIFVSLKYKKARKPFKYKGLRAIIPFSGSTPAQFKGVCTLLSLLILRHFRFAFCQYMPILVWLAKLLYSFCTHWDYIISEATLFYG